MSKSICADISNTFRRCVTNPNFITSLKENNYELLKYFINEHNKTHTLFENALKTSQSEDKIVKLYAVYYRLEVMIFFALKEIEKEDEDVFDKLKPVFSSAAPGVRRFQEILTLSHTEFPKDLTLSETTFMSIGGYKPYQMSGVNVFPYIDHYSPVIEKGKYVPGEIIDFDVSDLPIFQTKSNLSINIANELYRLYDDIHYLLKFLSLNYRLRLEENKWSNENINASIYKHEISGPSRFIAYSSIPESDYDVYMYNVYFADSFKSLANMYKTDSQYAVLACKSLIPMDIFIKMYHHLVFPKLIGKLTPELVSLYFKNIIERREKNNLNLEHPKNIPDTYIKYVEYLKNQDVKFIFIRHRIDIEGNVGHANLIIYNKYINEIEIFDPTEITSTEIKIPKQYVSTKMKKNYSPDALNKLFGTTNIKYYYIPFQLVQGTEYASNISGKGTCASWTSWFTEQRLKYYEYSASNVINILKGSDFYPRLSFSIAYSPKKIGYTGRYFTELTSSYITHVHRHFSYTLKTIFSLFKEASFEENNGKLLLLDKISIDTIQNAINELLNKNINIEKNIIDIEKVLSGFTSLEKNELKYNIGQIMVQLLYFLEIISRDDIVNGYSEPTKFKAPPSTYYTGYIDTSSYTHVNPYSKFVKSVP